MPWRPLRPALRAPLARPPSAGSSRLSGAVGRASHWPSAAGRGGGAGADWLAGARGGARGQHGGAGAAERGVRDRERQETGGGEGGGSAGWRAGLPPFPASPSLFTASSPRRSRRFSGTPLPTRWWPRRLTVSCGRGLWGCGGSARPGPARPLLSAAPSLCPQCPSTRGSRTRSRCRSAAKPPGRSLLLPLSLFPAGWRWRDPRQGH